MLEDEAILMFESYRRLKDHLAEKKDNKGLEIFCEVIKNTDMLISGLFEFHEEYVNQIKEIVGKVD